MYNINIYNNSIFESIKHIDENGIEFWYARELQKVLDYKKWENFNKVIKQAIESCKNSGFDINKQFPEVRKLSTNVNGGERLIIDYKLSRYACYLITQNGDPRKEVIALGQTYFAIQTRKQELNEQEYENLSEDKKRLYQRSLTRKGNLSLNKTASSIGVIHFDKFTNEGYKGLYNGETADDIAKRKGLRYREEILDYMGSEELADNLFRIVQTEAKLKKEKVIGEKEANKVHYKMGKDIRSFILKQGGTMPENLPKPKKSIKEIEKNNNDMTT